jgi:hypothetical protein
LWSAGAFWRTPEEKKAAFVKLGYCLCESSRHQVIFDGDERGTSGWVAEQVQSWTPRGNGLFLATHLGNRSLAVPMEDGTTMHVTVRSDINWAEARVPRTDVTPVPQDKPWDHQAVGKIPGMNFIASSKRSTDTVYGDNPYFVELRMSEDFSRRKVDIIPAPNKSFFQRAAARVPYDDSDRLYGAAYDGDVYEFRKTSAGWTWGHLARFQSDALRIVAGDIRGEAVDRIYVIASDMSGFSGQPATLWELSREPHHRKVVVFEPELPSGKSPILWRILQDSLSEHAALSIVSPARVVDQVQRRSKNGVCDAKCRQAVTDSLGADEFFFVKVEGPDAHLLTLYQFDARTGEQITFARGRIQDITAIPETIPMLSRKLGTNLPLADRR